MNESIWEFDPDPFLNELFSQEPIEEFRVFTDPVAKEMGRKFAIPLEFIPLFQMWFEKAAIVFVQEVGSEKKGRQEIISELRSVSDAASMLETILSELSDEAASTLAFSAARNWALGNKYPRLSRLSERGLKNGPLYLQLSEPTAQELNEVELVKLREFLTALVSCTETARKFSGEGKRGRTSHEAMYGLAFIVYVIWAGILGRKFTLHWADDSSGLSPASQFLEYVVHTIDSDIQLKKAATAARKIQDLVRENSDLKNIGRIVIDKIKRIDSENSSI